MFFKRKQPLDFVPMTEGPGLVVTICSIIVLIVVVLWAGFAMLDGVLESTRNLP